MVRGRIGGTGTPFNLGEMTVTRCALRLEAGGGWPCPCAGPRQGACAARGGGGCVDAERTGRGAARGGSAAVGSRKRRRGARPGPSARRRRRWSFSRWCGEKTNERRALTGGFAEAPCRAAQGVSRGFAGDGRAGDNLSGGRGAAACAAVGRGGGAVADALRWHDAAASGGACGLRRGARLDHVSLWRAFGSGRGGAVCLGQMGGVAAVGRFAIGLPDYPDRSVTLIVEMAELSAEGAVLRGPGIEREARLSLPEVAAFQDNRALFPLGFDCFFTCGSAACRPAALDPCGGTSDVCRGQRRRARD